MRLTPAQLAAYRAYRAQGHGAALAFASVLYGVQLRRPNH